MLIWMNSLMSFGIAADLIGIPAFLVLSWDFVCSSGANNLGTFLVGITSAIVFASGAFYFFCVRKEKRLEKRSKIADESLIAGKLHEDFIYHLKALPGTRDSTLLLLSYF
jgi:hypothetical protein